MGEAERQANDDEQLVTRMQSLGLNERIDPLEARDWSLAQFMVRSAHAEHLGQRSSRSLARLFDRCVMFARERHARLVRALAELEDKDDALSALLDLPAAALLDEQDRRPPDDTACSAPVLVSSLDCAPGAPSLAVITTAA